MTVLSSTGVGWHFIQVVYATFMTIEKKKARVAFAHGSHKFRYQPFINDTNP